jgi:hypothetical protein
VNAIPPHVAALLREHLEDFGDPSALPDASALPTLLQREPLPWEAGAELPSVIVSSELQQLPVEAPARRRVAALRKPPPLPRRLVKTVPLDAATVSAAQVSAAPANAAVGNAAVGAATVRMVAVNAASANAAVNIATVPVPSADAATPGQRATADGAELAWTRTPRAPPTSTPAVSSVAPADSQTLRDRRGIEAVLRRARARAVMGVCVFLGSALAAGALVLRQVPAAMAEPMVVSAPETEPAPAPRLPRLVMVSSSTTKPKPGRPSRSAPAKPARPAAPAKSVSECAPGWDALSEVRD